MSIVKANYTMTESLCHVLYKPTKNHSDWKQNDSVATVSYPFCTSIYCLKKMSKQNKLN